MKKLIVLLIVLITGVSASGQKWSQLPVRKHVADTDKIPCLTGDSTTNVMVTIQAIADFCDSLNSNYTPTSFNDSVKSSASITLYKTAFNGYTVYLCTNTSGIQALHLPAPATIKRNTVLWIKLNGRNIPHLYPFVSELLEGQSVSVGYWPIPSPLYMTGPFLPVQTFGVYTDGTNWHLEN